MQSNLNPFFLGVVRECLAEDFPHNVQDRRVEMVSSECALRWTTKTCFERKAVYQIEFSPHNHSGSWLTRFLDLEGAILETEILIVLCVNPKDGKSLES